MLQWNNSTILGSGTLIADQSRLPFKTHAQWQRQHLKGSRCAILWRHNLYFCVRVCMVCAIKLVDPSCARWRCGVSSDPLQERKSWADYIRRMFRPVQTACLSTGRPAEEAGILRFCTYIAVTWQCFFLRIKIVTQLQLLAMPQSPHGIPIRCGKAASRKKLVVE